MKTITSSSNEPVQFFAEQETPANAFKYSLNNKGIGISKYIGNELHVRIPSEIDGQPVVSIGHAAFHEIGIKSCYVPDSVTSISYSAFYDCNELLNVRLSTNITSIEKYTFFGCTKLTSIEIPDSVTEIEDYAFQKCTSLTEIIIPDSVTKIADNAFNGCSIIPERLTILRMEEKAKKEQNTKKSIELANALLGSMENAEIARNLFNSLLEEVQPSIYISNSVQITGKDEKKYKFYALKGDLCGGSEWEVDVEELGMTCLEDNTHHTFFRTSGGYSR